MGTPERASIGRYLLPGRSAKSTFT